LVVHLSVDICLLGSFVRKGINNDTEEDVHENDVDNHEESKVEHISSNILWLSVHRLIQNISHTSSSSDTIIDGAGQTSDKTVTVHVEVHVLLWSMLVVTLKALEGKE
jgi:hypothetical protein